MIGRFFATMFFLANREAERMRRCLVAVLFATIIGAIPILLFRPSVGICLWITLVPLVFSAYKLFSIRRFIFADIAGEVLEALHMRVDDPANPNPSTSIVDNKFIRIYLSVISGIFAAQVGLFLLLPLYVNYTVGGFTALILITMISAIMIIASHGFFAKTYMALVGIACVVYVIGLVLYLFPQISYYLPLSRIDVISVSSAKIIRETDELRKQQIEALNNGRLRAIMDWQRENPTKDLPEEFKKVQEAAGKGLTVERYWQQKAEAAEAAKKAAEIAAAEQKKAEAKAKADREEIEREAAKIEAARNAARNPIQETPEELRRRLKAIQRAKELRPGPDGLYHIGGGVPQPKPPVAVYVD